jgi:hypothetical protein
MGMIAALDFHYRGRARPSRFVAKIARALRLADGFRWCDMGKAGADVELVMSIPSSWVEPLEWR